MSRASCDLRLSSVRVLALTQCLIIAQYVLAVSGVQRNSELGFVRIRNGQFVESRTEAPVRARGANVYWLRYSLLGNEQERERVEVTLDAMQNLGLDVVRTWAFMDGDDESFDGRAMQPREGVFNEKAFVGLDQLLIMCAKRRIRVILTLTNFWPDYGGIQRYVEWARAAGDLSVYRREDFFSSTRCSHSFERFVRALVTRVNSVSGIAYKDDPVIFSYQLINEPRLAGSTTSDTFDEWATRTAAFVKQLDDSRHLVSCGTEGFFMRSDKVGFNPFAGAERQGVDIESLREIGNLDWIAVHIWTDDWMDSDDESKLRFLDRWIRAHLETAGTKPLIIEEFGKRKPVSVRDQFFTRVFTLASEERRRPSTPSVGCLFWLLSPTSVNDYDGFTVYTEDASTLSIVREDVNRLLQNISSETTDVTFPDEHGGGDDSGEDQDVVVEFPFDAGDDRDAELVEADTSLMRIVECRMLSSNEYEAHATYGDYVALEIDVVALGDVEISLDFAAVQSAMTVINMKRIDLHASPGSPHREQFHITFGATRFLGESGIYVDEGPMKFKATVRVETRDGPRTYVFKDGVTRGTTVVFDATAPHITDAFLRPYARRAMSDNPNAVGAGDIAVLYVAFSEPLRFLPKIQMNGRDAHVSLASVHGNAFYGYIEISPVLDADREDVTFSVESARDRSGNPCHACAADSARGPTDAMKLLLSLQDL
jgi:mannan endo-1,4-beta-mannosidase